MDSCSMFSADFRCCSSPIMTEKPKVEILNPEGYRADPTNLTIILHEEDHTIGNSLKHILCGMKDVEFCGYNIPHPLEDKILIRLQTRQGVEAHPLLLQAFENLKMVFTTIRGKFETEYGQFVKS